jgi:hypothetical protein
LPCTGWTVWRCFSATLPPLCRKFVESVVLTGVDQRGWGVG